MQTTSVELAQNDAAAMPAPYSRLRSILISALLAPGAGLVASLSAVATMGVLRLALGIPTPVELFGDFVLKHIDVGTFIRLLERFAPHSKTGPLSLALLGMIGVGIVLGWLYAAIVLVKLPTAGYRPARREWLTAAAFTLGMSGLGIILFWDELRQNLFGLTVGWATFVSALGLFADFAIYGFVLCLAYRALLPKVVRTGTNVAVARRRQWLARAGVAALTLGTGAGTLGLVQEYLNEYASYDGFSPAPPNGFTPPITPNNDHYVVTQNTIDPTVNIDLWRLEIGGLIGTSGSYTYDELQQLPSTSRAITLECIANEVGGRLMSTSIWQGVTLRTLLEKHGGAQSTASHIAFYSVDGYNISLPLQEVLAEEPLLAWHMNGQPLPYKHGFPLRVLIPGRYGEENPKWVTRIALTDHFIGGLYSDQGWYHGYLHTTSRIDRPAPYSQVALGNATEIGGIAFAGNRGIQQVEVSVDGGLTWQTATMQPALSQDSWVLWSWQWKPTLAGAYTIMARATDGTGAVQTSQKQGTVPNGATGYPVIHVTVS